MTGAAEIARRLRPATAAKLAEWGDDRLRYCAAIPTKSSLRRLGLIENYGGGAYYITNLGVEVLAELARIKGAAR